MITFVLIVYGVIVLGIGYSLGYSSGRLDPLQLGNQDDSTV